MWEKGLLLVLDASACVKRSHAETAGSLKQGCAFAGTC
jgi:hypothetical protein